MKFSLTLASVFVLALIEHPVNGVKLEAENYDNIMNFLKLLLGIKEREDAQGGSPA